MIGFRETTLDQLSIDHQIEINTLTGTARLSVPIRASAGRESFGPSLALAYGSGERNSTFGVGWSLSGVPSIGLDTTQGLPTYQAAEERYVYGGGQELLPYLRKQAEQWLPVVEPRGDYWVQRFRSKVERSFERFERWTHRTTGRAHWVVFARNGVVSVFGKADDNSTRIADPADPDQRTFQWLLEAQYDPKGNAIVYQYKAEDGAGVDASQSFETRRIRAGGGFAQRYLKRILYGNSKPLSRAQPVNAANEWHFEVVFDYGEHPANPVPTPSDVHPAPPWTVRQDPFSTHRPGFELRTYRLCKRVLMFHRFAELGGAPCLVGATELKHRDDAAGSVLDEVTYRGYRRDLATNATTHRTLPALKLTYSGSQGATFFEVPEPADNVPWGLDGTVYQWVDLKNEGLPGILCRQGGSWFFKENIGGGRFGSLQQVDEVPAAVSAAFQLQDFDGDGNLNLVGFEGREAGHYRHDRDGRRWEGFRAFRNLPRVDFANARVQWVDLNGDGHSDLVVEHDDRLVWYPSEGADGFATPIEIAKPDVRTGGAPTLIQDRRLHTFFADMTGDGLLDMVRIESGRVEYWPNLGHGRFGKGVVMDDAPSIDGVGELDLRRLRLVDLDGSGTADLLYIAAGEIRCWSNLSGNRFSAERRIPNLPIIDNLASAQVFDFLGDGTRCLVWSTPLPTHEGQAIQYLRLSEAVPPRLLLSVANGIGRESRVSYRSSASDYLRDKAAARPWRTLLPRHSMVVEQLEGLDLVGGSRLVTKYEYHDGYFDDEKRRFVGFGIVDSFDTDKLQANGGTPPEEVTPPSLVRSWYHTGAADGFVSRASDFYARDPAAVRLPDPVIERISDLTTEEQLDAYRVLAGVQWRQEFYAVRSNGERALHPLRTTEFAYRVQRLQPAQGERDAGLTFVQSELLRYEYEEEPSDPRVSHEVLIESDAYGNITKRASLAYPRRPVGAGVRPEQRILHAEYVEKSYQSFDIPERFEVGIEGSERRFSLGALDLDARGVFDRSSLLVQVEQALASPIAFHDPALPGASHARLIGFRRNVFWDDARSAALPPGQVGSVTLLHHVERAVLPEGAIDPLYGGRVTGLMLVGDGDYRRADGFWWADDTTYRYGDVSSFYRFQEERSANGGLQTYTFDPHFLLVTTVLDVFGNRVESVPDYQVLASSRVKDANDNVSEALYDELGVAVVTGLRGQQLGSDGNPHPVGIEALSTYVARVGATAADVLSDPANLLQNASRFFFYDLGAFARGEGPPRSIHLEREQHVHDGEGNAPSVSRIRVTVRYVDGFGRPIQTKVRADAGPAIQRTGAGTVIVDADGTPLLSVSAERWLTSGHDVYNNKGWLVRKYEPFFSTRPVFESDDSLRRYGVATRTHFDPVGRVVRQDFPNKTYATTEYNSWSTRQADANDNVAGSAYEAERLALPNSEPEKRALTSAQAHSNTPTIVESDALGRPFRMREVGEAGVERVTTTIFGVLGFPDRIIDPRSLTAFAYRYDMLGRTLCENSLDAGERFTLFDSQGRAVHRWDARGVHSRHRYDENGRPVETRVDGALGLDNVVERVVYGDNPLAPQAELRNVRGRVVQHSDDAGVRFVERYHLDGQAVDVRRSLRTDYKDTVDWSDPSRVGMSGAEYRSRSRLDALGRVVEQRLPDGTTREYDYAALGHVSEVRLTTADGQLNRKVIGSNIETNAKGQRTRLRLGSSVETSFEYDRNTFRLERLYTRRVLGAPRAYLDVQYTYDPVGNVTRWLDRVQDPGASTPLIQGLTVSSACEFTYDPFYRLRSATGRVHQALLQHDYNSGLDGANPIKGTQHLSLNNGAAVERYTRTYDYDLAGNIQRIRHLGSTQNWTTEMWTSPTSNRSLPKKDLNDIDIANPASRFDENGNTIALPHLRAMVWNHASQLARAVIIDRSGSGDPDDAEYYVYGADGLRVRRVTERLVHGQLEVVEATYLEGCEIRRVSRAGNTRLLRQTSHITDGSARIATLHQWSVDQTALETDDIGRKKLHYLVGNHLGSVSLELDEAGDVISYEEFFPFGGTSFIAGQSVRDVKLKEYRYSGKCRDDATGFYHYEYRYYAPFIGNWISPDPIGPADGLNLYQFVHNNPIRFVDADGLQTTFGSLDAVPENVRQAVFANTPEAQRTVEAYAEASVIDIGGDLYRLDVEVVPITDSEGRFVRWWAQEVSRERVGETLNFEEGETIVGDPDAEPPAEEAPDGKSGSRPVWVGDPDAEPPAEEEAPEEPDAGGAGGLSDADGGGSTAHPADGSSGTGSTARGQTGESGSNGSATTGQGPGAGERGRGTGGGGQSPAVGQGTQGTGTGTGQQGTGTGAAPGAGSGGGGRGQQGASGEAPGGDPRGRPGGTGTAGSQSSGTARDGGASVPPAPPGVPTGPDGIPYSPDLQLPEITPEAGTPVSDPNQVRAGTPGGDPRGEVGSESGSGVRPGGVEGGTAGGTPGGEAEGAPGGQGEGQEGGQPGGGRGLKGGVGEHELPSWLSWIDTALDGLQIGLDVIGLIPGLGEIADGINGLISLARGDYVGASLSFAAMIPFAGWAATAGKFGRRAVRAAEAVADVSSAVTRYGDEAAGIAGIVTRSADDVASRADDLIDVYRGTGRTSEHLAFQESSHLFSDSARRAFLESGNIGDALAASQARHAELVRVFGSEGALAEAQARLGTEFIQQFGERSLFSVTTDPGVARYFAGPEGLVFHARVPAADLIRQTLPSSTEAELFVRHLSDLFKVME